MNSTKKKTTKKKATNEKKETSVRDALTENIEDIYDQLTAARDRIEEMEQRVLRLEEAGLWKVDMRY
jgi:flagellar hook-basal body complex protein FliE